MKKQFEVAIFATSLFLANPLSAFAAVAVDNSGGGAGTLCPTDSFAALCKYKQSNAGGIIGSFINIIFVVVTIVALLYLIWGGFKWLVSGGDSKAVDTARGHIIAAIIGLVIVFLSYFILNIVVGLFIPGFSIANFTIPSITVAP